MHHVRDRIRKPVAIVRDSLERRTTNDERPTTNDEEQRRGRGREPNDGRDRLILYLLSLC